ncbi:TPA: hypothetical protein ACH3X2_008192 [Trebouxia sp. C0005]
MPPGSTFCEAGLYSVRSSCLLTLHAAGVQKTLLKGYDRVLGDEPSRQETSFSLRAVGCFGTGLHQQTIDICAEWLNHVGKGGHAVWANVLTAYARLNLARRPHKLRQVADDLSCHRAGGRAS